jgi:arylsulfatase
MKTSQKIKSWCAAAATMVAMSLNGIAGDAVKRPNIMIILADDMGFSDPGCYGGEIRTPNMDSLAKDGLRFTQFYNTARCWPTRSALMTGYYPQEVRMDPPWGRVPTWTQSIPQLLKPLGYMSYHSGKWHISGLPKTCADAGFDRSYRIEDPDHHFNPKFLFEDDKKLPPVPPNSGYYDTTAIGDHMIGFLKEHAEKYPTRPFFAYVAFLSPHFPLMAPAEDIAKYKDRYVEGWDAVRQERYAREKEMGIVNCTLSKMEPTILAADLGKAGKEKKISPNEVPYALPWDSLSGDQKRFEASKMAVHAAMVDHVDQTIGRITDQLKAMGAWDNTVIFVLSDNGASSELLLRGDGNDQSAPAGSAKSFLCIGPGWATMSNTPYRRYKIWVQEGGISTAFIVHWPEGISAHGELRHDMGHVVDLLPTAYELAFGHAPELKPGAPPLAGRSLVPEFSKDGAVTRDFLFFDHSGNRALREGNWKLVSAKIDHDQWSLYDLSTDRAESNDLAAKYPERVQRMNARWHELEDKYRSEAASTSGGPVTAGLRPRDDD